VIRNLNKEYRTNVNYTISGNFRLGDIRDNYADLSKIKVELGFKPKVSFEQGIKFFCQWVSNQEIENDKFSESFEEMKNKGLLK
jgi:dTDP-L-rhamnose 4-epimerase